MKDHIGPFWSFGPRMKRNFRKCPISIALSMGLLQLQLAWKIRIQYKTWGEFSSIRHRNGERTEGKRPAFRTYIQYSEYISVPVGISQGSP